MVKSLMPSWVRRVPYDAAALQDSGREIQLVSPRSELFWDTRYELLTSLRGMKQMLGVASWHDLGL